jgi:hypothetical protein
MALFEGSGQLAACPIRSRASERVGNSVVRILVGSLPLIARACCQVQIL